MELVNPGIFRANYLVCEIETKKKGWKVKRKDKDFVLLRSLLSKLYPGCVIPLLSETVLLKSTTETLDKNKHILQVFLDEVISHPLLSTAEFLHDFLSASDQDFEKQSIEAESLHAPRNVADCYTIEGATSITYNHALGEFCLKLNNSTQVLKSKFHELFFYYCID